MRKRILYSYNLNENHKGGTRVCKGITISSAGVRYHSRNKELEEFIKTKKNPEGFLTYEEIDLETNKVVFSSKEQFDKRVILSYKRDSLSTMKRPELEAVAKSFDINPVRKTNAFLTNLILKSQDEIKLENNIVIVEEEKQEKQVDKFGSAGSGLKIEDLKPTNLGPELILSDIKDKDYNFNLEE